MFFPVDVFFTRLFFLTRLCICCCFRWRPVSDLVSCWEGSTHQGSVVLTRPCIQISLNSPGGVERERNIKIRTRKGE